jgi:outer membrane protein assembly factor BamB
MKKILSLVVACLSCFVFTKLEGQVSNVSATWKSTFPNNPNLLMYANSDGRYIVGSSSTDVSVLDGTNGKLLWKANFQEKLGSKKCEMQYVMDDAGILLLYNKRGNNDVMYVVDLHTGEELWNTDRFEKLRLSSIQYLKEKKGFMITTKDGLSLYDGRTGNRIWNVDRWSGSLARMIYDAGKDELIMLNYKTSWGALLSGYKNQIMSVNASNGIVNWAQEYFGVMHINPRTDKPVFDMDVKDNHIYLMINGLEVLDRNTGNKLWKTEYEVFDQKVPIGAPGMIYFYNGVAKPLITKDAVYLVYNRPAGGKVAVQKLDLNSGNMLWEYRVEGKNNPVPKLILTNERLLVQLGGRINIVGPEKVGNSYITTSKYKWIGNFGVVALNPANGQEIWKQSKMKDQLSNIEMVDNLVYYADAKALYAVNIQDGSDKGNVPVKTLKCGAPFEVLRAGNRIVVAGNAGMSGVNAEDLKVVYTNVDSKVADYSEQSGDYYLMKADKAMSIVDIHSGNKAAVYKWIKGAKWALVNDDKTLMVITSKEAQRFDLASTQVSKK